MKKWCDGVIGAIFWWCDFGAIAPHDISLDEINDENTYFTVDDWKEYWKVFGDRRTLVRVGPTAYRLADAVFSFMQAKNFTDITLVRLKDTHSPPKNRISQSHHASPVDVKTPHDCHLYTNAIKSYYDILNTDLDFFGRYPGKRDNNSYRK